MNNPAEEKLRKIANLATYAAPTEYATVKDGRQRRRERRAMERNKRKK